MTGPGRPSTGVRIDIRIPPELLADIDKHAKRYEISRAEMIRHLLTFATERTPLR